MSEPETSKRRGAWTALIFLVVSIIPRGTPAFEAADVAFCHQGDPDRLCPHLPKDVTEFDAAFIYRFLSPSVQLPFDVFAWQSFMALNWPPDVDRQPRTWQTFARPDQVLRGRAGPEVCPPAPPGTLVTSTFLQPTGEPLIDRAGNYVVYDLRVNAVAASHMRARDPADHPGRLIDFPAGAYADREERRGGRDGALIVKTAWRILDADTADERRRYFTRPGRIAISADQSRDHRPRCLAVTLGLVGMHIVQKTTSGNGDKWIWATFEHADNAPLAANARGPNSIIPENLFPDGCRAPAAPDHAYAFFDPACPTCPTNAIETRDWTWAAEPPYAAGLGLPPPRVVRCWRPFAGTEKLNGIWRRKLASTVWANYFLVGTQWVGNPGGAPFGMGEVPRYLSNTTIETYVQDAEKGSCLGCHADARTAAGAKSDFTFLFARP